MSFSALINNEVSKICAFAEEATTILTLPGEDVLKWTKKYPECKNGVVVRGLK
jgi:hypothetical protein